jgi:hypothetical protein
MVLEIGPGRGAWTKTFRHLNAMEIWCVDVAPSEHTGFADYVGFDESLHYLCVKDASLKEIRNSSITYFFSFGTFCHLPREIVTEYLGNLAVKLKSGAHGFLMVGDFDKYNNCIEQSASIFEHRGRWMFPFRILWIVLKTIFPHKYTMKKLDLNDSLALADVSGLGSWYHLSTEDACSILTASGFEIVERDMMVCPRDPVIHFVKP